MLVQKFLPNAVLEELRMLQRFLRIEVTTVHFHSTSKVLSERVLARHCLAKFLREI